ncbi:MAG TPA: class I SAM-dependent methyltransferase [Actinocatenispora sp.]
MESSGRARLAAVFGAGEVAEAYRHRPPYPAEVFDALTRLAVDRPRRVLDLGAGEGALARPLADRVDQVDALDVSAAMLAAGARRPGGDSPRLRWILGDAATAPLTGPYALVTAGASLHWMPWRETLTRVAAAMTDRAVLAIVEHGYHEPPWAAELLKVIVRHSRSPDHDPAFSLPDELSRLGLLRVAGRLACAPVPFRQSVADYVEQFHSTASLARTWMSDDESAAFDAAVTDVVTPYATGGNLTTTVAATVTWGRPTP